MAKNHVQAGDVMTWTNGTGSAVTSGSVVVVGDRIGVALVDIADGKSGEVATEEVYNLPKNTAAMAQGKKCYWDATAGQIVLTASGNTVAGNVHTAALGGDTQVAVKLGA